MESEVSPVALAIADPVPAPPVLAPVDAGTAVTPGVGQAVARGVLWTAVGKWGSQIVAWASTVIVARILTPADYGIVAMAAVFTDLVSYVCELGIGQSLLVYRNLDARQVRQLNALAVLLGIAGALLTVALATTLAVPIFGNPKLPAVLIALSPTFVISSLRTVPSALLQRELRFGRLAVYDAIQAVVLAGAALALATAGAGYWTLVVSLLIASTMSAAGIVTARPVGFARPRFAELRDAMRLSRNVLASRLMWYAYARADTLIVGRVLGSSALGNYSLAWTVANVPVDKAGAVVSQVVPGVFSTVADDRRTLGRYFLSATEIIALLLAPPCIGLALTAHDFVETVLGARWLPMATPLAVLAVFAAARALKPLVSQALITAGQSGRDTLYNFMLLLTFPAALWLAAPHGLVWVAAMWLVVFPPLLAWQIGMALRAVDRTPLEYLRALWPALQACAAVATVVVASKVLLPAGSSPRIRLGVAAAAGAGVYVAYVVLRQGHKIREFRALAGAK